MLGPDTGKRSHGRRRIAFYRSLELRFVNIRDAASASIAEGADGGKKKPRTMER
jgi:hypothetical protein